MKKPGQGLPSGVTAESDAARLAAQVEARRLRRQAASRAAGAGASGAAVDAQNRVQESSVGVDAAALAALAARFRPEHERLSK